MRKSLVWEGNLNKKKNFLDCRTWNEPLENIKKKTQKREVRLILTLHPSLLQCSPICHFYFLGSPLCFFLLLPPSFCSLLVLPGPK